MAPRQSATFEQARKDSKNGKQALGAVIQGRRLTYRARANRGRALIDIDLHPGNHDLRPEVQEELWRRHSDYCSAFDFRSRTHTHFNKTSIMCEVKSEHAEEWFSLLWDAVTNVESLSRIRCEFLSDYAARKCGQIVAGGILLSSRVRDGDLVKAVAPAFQKIIELLQFDYEILHCISPRQFEELLAAAYDRLGFDSVVLTPRSGDHGRDVIVEKRGWGSLRLFVEAKRYKTDNLVKASEVRSLLGTLITEQPTTKAILVTTSDFAPEVRNAPNIAPLLGTRLQLLNGEQLVERLVQIEHSSEKPRLGF